MTFSVHLRANLLADAASVSAFPESFLRLNADRFLLKALPIALKARPWPVAIVTLKHRTLSPLVERFIESAREVAQSFNKKGFEAMPGHGRGGIAREDRLNRPGSTTLHAKRGSIRR